MKNIFMTLAIAMVTMVTMTSCSSSLWEGMAAGMGNMGGNFYGSNNGMFSNYWDNINVQSVSATPTANYSSTSSSRSSYSSSSTRSASSTTTATTSRQHDLCNGTGKCNTCNGTGMMWKGFGLSGKTKCPNCNGNGRCSGCRGTGRRG